jgi:AraC-like DNA-binding protein
MRARAAVPARTPAVKQCHPTGPSLPTPVRWRWGSTDLLPGQQIAEYDYVLPEEDPISAGVKVYGHCDHLDRFDMHDALECGFVLEGRLKRYWGSTRQARLLGPGCIWFCPSYEPNGYRLVETPCRLAVFEIRPQFIASLHFAQAPTVDWLQAFSAPWRERPGRVKDLAALRALLERLEWALHQRDPLRRVQVQTILVDFLCMVMAAQRNRPARPGRNRELHEGLRTAIELVLRTQERVDNTTGAKACGMSVDQFMRAFRSVMGVSFIRFGLRHRLQGAAHALTSGDRPLKAIAAEWGFADESHLSHLFVKHMNCTPSIYRERTQSPPAPAGR